MEAKDRIILALDVDTRTQALQLVDELAGLVGVYKIGMQLFNNTGPSIIEEINSRGGRVFLDLKLHDIPNTVAAAGRVLTRQQVFMYNVHAAGGREMLSQVVAASQDEAERQGIPSPLLLAVTVLTSLSQSEVESDLLIRGMSIEEIAVRWSLMAREAGLAGVVSSPQEITAIRKACGPDFKIVTPGIRPAWAASGDQKRITTPRQALDSGADYIVIGRPITGEPKPAMAAQRIIEEMED